MSKCYSTASVLVALSNVSQSQLTPLFSAQNICRLEPEEQTCPNLLHGRAPKHAYIAIAEF